MIGKGDTVNKIAEILDMDPTSASRELKNERRQGKGERKGCHIVRKLRAQKDEPSSAPVKKKRRDMCLFSRSHGPVVLFKIRVLIDDYEACLAFRSLGAQFRVNRLPPELGRECGMAFGIPLLRGKLDASLFLSGVM